MILRFLLIILFVYLYAGDLFANRCPDDDETRLRTRPTLDHSQECENASGIVDFMIHYDTSGSLAINQEDTELIDYALERKVLLCSPLTLYAMLSLIYQATRNFAMEGKATEVLNLVNAFRLQWEKYVEVMDKMGRSLDTAKKDYDTLVTTRKNQLEKPLTQIEEITSGGETAELVE